MILLFKKYYRIIFALLFTFLFIGYYLKVFSVNYQPSIKEFKKDFKELESKLDTYLKQESKRIIRDGDTKIWSSYTPNKELNLHIYKNDSLIFWSTNQLPILRFADIHFPSNGVLHLQNGWYYSKMLRIKNCQLVASFLIKKDYPYENSTIKNTYN